MVIDLEKFVGRQAKGLAMAGIAFIGERHDGVDAVVAAVQLDDDEDASITLCLGGSDRLSQKAGHRGRKRQESGGFEEMATGKHKRAPRFLVTDWWRQVF